MELAIHNKLQKNARFPRGEGGSCSRCYRAVIGILGTAEPLWHKAFGEILSCYPVSIPIHTFRIGERGRGRESQITVEKYSLKTPTGAGLAVIGNSSGTAGTADNSYPAKPKGAARVTRFSTRTLRASMVSGVAIATINRNSTARMHVRSAACTTPAPTGRDLRPLPLATPSPTPTDLPRKPANSSLVIVNERPETKTAQGATLLTMRPIPSTMPLKRAAP